MKLNKTIYSTIITVLFLGSLPLADLSGQAVPGKDENIPFLCTFGKQGKTSWGDDDFYSGLVL